MLLSREQEIKKVFIQLGSRYNLPKDIILKLYNSLEEAKEDDLNISRKYHLDMIYHNIYDRLHIKSKDSKIYSFLYLQKDIGWVIQKEAEHIEYIAFKVSLHRQSENLKSGSHLILKKKSIPLPSLKAFCCAVVGFKIDI